MNDRKTSGKGSKNKSSKAGSIKVPEPAVLNCALCGEVIKDNASSIALPETGDPVHFECAMDKIKKSETLAEDETLVYLGSGNFGIIKRSSRDPADFKIIKKIEFENKEKIGAWRKKLSYKI